MKTSRCTLSRLAKTSLTSAGIASADEIAKEGCMTDIRGNSRGGALHLIWRSIAGNFSDMNALGKEIKMKVLENLKLVGISMLLFFGLAACEKPGPAETAGKKIDQTVDEAGKKMAETTDIVAEKLGEQSEKAGVAINDAEITTKVKAAILAEPGLKTLQISVDTVKGVVTLSGSVDSQPSSDKAKALAGAVTGVKGVENKLVLKPIK